MKLGLTLLSCAVFYTITQDFLYGVNATTNNGDLILNSNEVLEINTTVPYINCSSSCNYHASHQNRSSSGNTSTVAVITFTGNITFKNGSIVKVFGEYALSMITLNGSIDIQTDINMTCGKKVLDTTCLGGFTQPAAGELLGPQGDKTLVHKGLGPGGLIFPKEEILVVNQCIPGSSHGGTGHRGSTIKAGPPYDKENMTSLLGGSGGTCLDSPGSAAGGGAIELVAEEGKIVISASIRASAQVPATHLSNCSGGSGGLIRLKANTVDIKEMGKLNVDGGHAHPPPGAQHDLGGGGGGIIQIIAPQGSLANDTLSLKHGKVFGQCDVDATNGHFLLKVNETTSPMFNGSIPEWNSSFYLWPRTSSNSGAVTTTHSSSTPAVNIATTPSDPPKEEPVNQLKKDVEYITMSIATGDKVNMSDINEVLTRHQSLAAILNNGIMDLCLRIFKGYQAIVDWVAKQHQNELEGTLRGILETASRCLRKENHAVWKETRNMPNLMQSLEDIFATVVNSSVQPEINYTIWTQKAVAEVVKKGVNSLNEDIRTPNYLDVEETTWKGVSDFVFIPKETAEKAKGRFPRTS